VGGEDGGDDGESEAGTGGELALIAAAIKLVEDEVAFVGCDARAVVFDADGEEIRIGGGVRDGGDADAAAAGGIFSGVLQEVAEDFADGGGVDEDVGEIGRGGEVDRVAGELGGVFVDGVVDEGGEGLRLAAEFDGTVVLLRHFNGLADEAVEAVALFVDDGDQFG